MNARAYPELRQLFGAYLNADFAAEYGTPEAAIRAYRDETGAAHRAAARAELERLHADGSPNDLAGRFALLGCEVHLPSPHAARALAEALRAGLGDG